MAVTTRTHTGTAVSPIRTSNAGEVKFTQQLNSYALQKSPLGVKRKLEEQLDCDTLKRISLTKQLKVARRRLFRVQLNEDHAGYY